ncbi:MAG: transcription elongation factor GreA [Thermoflexales bacterium]
MNETEFLTPEGFKKLEDELEFLKTKRRSDVAQRLHEAMEEGETEENPEYEDAKNEQAFVEGRILTIETILGNAKLIEMKGPSNEVRLGSKLTITEVGTSDKEHYTLVGSAEADPKHGKISNESPMGKALLGRKLHEVVSVTTPSGLMKFKIVHISNK